MFGIPVRLVGTLEHKPQAWQTISMHLLIRCHNTLAQMYRCVQTSIVMAAMQKHFAIAKSNSASLSPAKQK